MQQRSGKKNEKKKSFGSKTDTETQTLVSVSHTLTVQCDDANKSYGKANYDKWSLLLPGPAVAIVSSKVTKTVA